MKHENFQCDCGYPVILFFLLVLFVCCTNVEKPYLELIFMLPFITSGSAQRPFLSPQTALKGPLLEGIKLSSISGLDIAYTHFVQRLYF